MSWAVAFTVCGAVLLVAAALGLLGIAHVRLSGQDAIERDGMATGKRAPAWSLTDSAGGVFTSPPSMPLQLVVFADHSLKSFPSVADGLRDLLTDGAPVEIVLLLRQPNPMAAPVLAELGLGAITVLTGSPTLYAKYNVRVGPFLIFVDSAGLVRASSLVNYAWQVAKLYQLATLPVAARFHLTSKVATATRQHVRATGVLDARGHSVLGRKIGNRRVIWLIFGRGSVRLVIRLKSRSASPPNLTTCSFTESARGDYWIRGGKRRYAHAAGTGTYVTRISGRLKRKNGRCTSTLSSYLQSTRTTGTMSW